MAGGRLIGESLGADHAPVGDLIQPFQLDIAELRGRLVRLGPVLDQIIVRHGYPEAVGQLLAETVTAAVLLASLLKYDGVFTLQAKGEWAVRLVVADVTSEGNVRGYAQFDEEQLPLSIVPGGLMRELLGDGYLAFTVDQGEDTERYQGIVSLTGENLTDAVRHYFQQSEQLETEPMIETAYANGHWHGAGIVLQRLPETERAPISDKVFDEAWDRAVILLATCRPDELMGTGRERELGPQGLLYRLFHEEDVRVFAPTRVQEACRCSEERVRSVVEALPPEEVDSLRVNGELIVTCEFCNRSYKL